MNLIGAERKSTTAELPIGGGRDFPRDESERSRWLSIHSQDIGEERALQLLNRYGTLAERLIEKISDQGEKFLSGGEYSDLEILHLIETEAVSNLSDLVYRRTNIGFVGSISDELLEQLVSLAAESLGWDQSEQKRQLKQLARQGVSA
jgi:glycerol-3-phosphate dehydrogenase